MEIRIKTAEEFRASHVTISVKAADSDEAMRVVAALVGGSPEGYDPSVTEVAEPLRQKISELEADITRRVDLEEVTRNRLAETLGAVRTVNGRCADLHGQLIAAQDARANETKRADEAERALIKTRSDREEAERALAILRDKVAQQRPKYDLDVDGLKAERDQAIRVIRQIAGVIARPSVRAAVASSPEGTVMAGALIKIGQITEAALAE